MTTESKIQKLHDMMDSVAREYPVEYRNYLVDSAFWDNNLYYDATHLNFTGATLFAERLVRDFGL